MPVNRQSIDLRVGVHHDDIRLLTVHDDAVQRSGFLDIGHLRIDSPASGVTRATTRGEISRDARGGRRVVVGESIDGVAVIDGGSCRHGDDRSDSVSQFVVRSPDLRRCRAADQELIGLKELRIVEHALFDASDAYCSGYLSLSVYRCADECHEKEGCKRRNPQNVAHVVSIVGAIFRVRAARESHDRNCVHVSKYLRT